MDLDLRPNLHLLVVDLVDSADFSLPLLQFGDLKLVGVFWVDRILTANLMTFCGNRLEGFFWVDLSRIHVLKNDFLDCLQRMACCVVPAKLHQIRLLDHPDLVVNLKLWCEDDSFQNLHEPNAELTERELTREIGDLVEPQNRLETGGISGLHLKVQRCNLRFPPA